MSSHLIQVFLLSSLTKLLLGRVNYEHFTPFPGILLSLTPHGCRRNLWSPPRSRSTFQVRSRDAFLPMVPIPACLHRGLWAHLASSLFSGPALSSSCCRSPHSPSPLYPFLLESKLSHLGLAEGQQCRRVMPLCFCQQSSSLGEQNAASHVQYPEPKMFFKNNVSLATLRNMCCGRHQLHFIVTPNVLPGKSYSLISNTREEGRIAHCMCDAASRKLA